jgi:pyruvate,orthophosphate dikinase
MAKEVRMIRSKALEINLARTQVEVPIDPRYTCLQEVMSRYYGLLEGLNAYLKEVSHPYKNWQYIVGGGRGYALDYFHMFKSHPRGPDAARVLMDIFFEALAAQIPTAVKVDAADNLVLFIQKIIKTSPPFFDRFAPLINDAFDRIADLPEARFILFVRSFYTLKRVAGDWSDRPGPRETDAGAIHRMLTRTLSVNLDYWLLQPDPLQWFRAEAQDLPPTEVLESIFAPITHAELRRRKERLETIGTQSAMDAAQTLHHLLEIPDHGDMIQAYRRVAQQLMEAGRSPEQGHRWKILFLFHGMAIEGLAAIHEETLRQINRDLEWLIAHQSAEQSQALVRKTFTILRALSQRYPATSLNCVLTMGQGLFTAGAPELFDEFIGHAIDLGFQAPMIGGVGNDWQIQVNSAHLLNIRAWLELIELEPRRASRLLSHLIIHLAVSGVFIRDNDLFGRDITRLLNSDIGPVYNLVKQLARLFPVYFNDIGAEGELRDISTRLDEICLRRDPLIHFLRKQSHVEGSNRILNLMEAALTFWRTRNKAVLADYLPPDIFGRVADEGLYVDGLHAAVQALAAGGLELPRGLITHPADHIAALCPPGDAISDVDAQRMVLFAEFYKQLNNKYNLDIVQLQNYVNQLPIEAFPRLEALKQAFDEPDLTLKITRLLDYLELLKNVILSPQAFEIREDIYKKRHITVDIPSMYGSYREMKFDALGLTLRIEALVNVLFEELVDTIDLGLITKATCRDIAEGLKLFDQALKIDGIASAELAHYLDLLGHSLEIQGFSFTQFLDIFKGFAQAVRNIINDYFNTVHGGHIAKMLRSIPAERIQKKYLPAEAVVEDDPEKHLHRISEIFLRDRLATSLGLQQLDLFLSRILNTMFHQSAVLPRDDLRRLLNYDPKRAISELHDPNPLADGIIYLGNKGLNLVKLIRFGLPVPPGFIITTQVFRCRDMIESFRPARENFFDQVARAVKDLEAASGKRFGDPGNPLLLSVRSGSAISQPGMMDTLLNVGMNEEITRGLAERTGNPWFAWDNYRRFLQCYGMGLGLERDDFDAIINRFKHDLGIPLKREFSGELMRALSLAYKERIIAAGHPVPDEPVAQLHQTIHSVMNSWESAKAKAYRRIMGISDEWGTAITVQAMVYGNLSTHSGAGVIFTHNPRWSGDRLTLWGDFTLENQGEDVVAGLVKTLPISLKQRQIEQRPGEITLESHFPVIYNTMKAWAHTLVYDKGWSPQEMEFTFESPSADQVYLLQTRDMGIREHKHVLTFDPDETQRSVYLGHGIGVSAGALSGRLVFSLEEIDRWRTEEPATGLILARGDTVPDDIQEIHGADGLLTARGGVTSHAAVVAHRLGKTCVVGCTDMVCYERRGEVRFGAHTLHSGDFISIDGREGSIYHGLIKIKQT